MKNLRKLFSLILCVSLVLGTFAAGGMTASADTVYTVTLDPGEGSGEPLVFRSSDQTEFPGWRDAQNLQFYLEDDGRMGFRLDSDYCPDTFIAPDDDFCFDTWSEGYTYHTLSSTNTVITALWNSNSFLIIGVNDVELDMDNYNAFCSFRPREAGTYGFYSNNADVNLIVIFDGKTYDIPYEDPFRFSKYLEANEVFTFEVKADFEYTDTISVTVASDVASYSLTPAEYTIENSGYSDITCSFDSLYLGPIVNDWGNIENANYIQFYLNGGTLTDGNGNSITFLVDDKGHSGPSGRNFYSNDYSSPDETVIMSVWIDPEVYDAAAPGTYTGELVYDCLWAPVNFPGVSGSIPLTLVIPEPETVYTVTLDPGEGSGEPIVYRSSDQTEFPGWNDAQYFQFYLKDNGEMGFRFNTSYVPDSFTAPAGYEFDGWEGAVNFNTFPSGVTDIVFTAKWRTAPASYSLSPSGYTIENSGYTDIPCSFDSLYLGYVTDEYETYQAEGISFYINAGTLTDGNGSSIPFLVDERFHFGAEDRVFTSNTFSSQEDTVIMSVWIDPEDYAAADPGTYTGELVYDSMWLGRGFYIAGESGSIALTLVIPDTAIPETYTGWEGTLEINESKDIIISGVNHDNTGTSYGSAIRICNNSEVNIYFEGENVLKGNPDYASTAGIEVEEGSTLNLYALDENSSLTATGGKYGAGIGGIGYGSISATNPKAGNINIYSGTIVATGGDKGAGIGSGYHSSAGDINIYGGDITAIGTGCGAGIGSGYGTSGGAAVAAGVGYYNGGNITISGGTVRATSASGNDFSFENFDIFDSSTYPAGDMFAAGIGGGYGASSGNIIIEGNAVVTAIGSCGGAGIGTGRGTPKSANYDSNNFNCNIIIRGNAVVTALATADHRTSVVGDDGGAAIGLGRGCTISGQPKGTISISENAEVTALAECWANAIGSGCAVGKFTKDADGNITRPEMAQMESVEIADTAVIHVYTDGNRGGVYEETPYLTVSFLDEDGALLQSGKYVWHAVPDLEFELPSKPMTDQYKYPLTGWDDGNGNVCPADAITPAEADVSYTPVFTETSRFTPSISANEVVRGDKLTWNIAGPLNVTWLKFNGTDESGNSFTSYYKYSNYNKGTTEASVTDDAEERVWNIPMVFNYAGTQAVDNQTWSIEFRVSGSSEWQAVPGDAFNIKVVKNAAALAPAPEEGEFAPYSVLAAVSEDREENGAAYKYFYITTTDDVSKVKISFVNADTGKTKSATYQTTSTNVVDLDTENGFSVWTIRMKVTAQAQDGAYTVQVRGPAWGEGVVAMSNQ